MTWLKGETVLRKENLRGVMRKINWTTLVASIIVWGMLPRGIARAQETIGGIEFYTNYSTGVAPFTWTTVNSDTGIEQQVTCNDGDVAIAGGYELETLPSPKGVVVAVPQSQFYFSGETPIGWMVYVQNINLNPLCNNAKWAETSCPAVQFRVSVSCVHEAEPG